MKRLLLIAALLTCVPGVNAYDARGGATTYAGNNSCGTFLKNVEDSEQMKAQYLAYIEGYVTAVNMRVKGRTDFFEHTDPESRYRFVYEYCRKNPLDSVITAIFQLALTAGVPLPGKP
ncbi:hypothetical protein [Cupriavidus sp.]|uniref:hypothetical protein n=1 Tax=Cupriavidus sp. TaxID=1873897 RepID=UPI003D0E63DC